MPSSSNAPDPNLVSERRWIQTPPIFFLPLAFAGGIGLVRYVPVSFFSAVWITAFVLTLLALRVRSSSFVPLAALSFFVIGVLFGLNDRSVSERNIALMGPTGWMVIEGEVVTAPETLKAGKREMVSFVLNAHDFYREGFVYRTEGKVQVFLHHPDREIHFGDRLRIRGTLEEPKSSRNPHAFNYAAYLAELGIFKVFRGVGRFSILRQEEGHGNRFLAAINRLRAHLKKRVETLLPVRHASLASAVLLGFRKDIARSVQDDFIRSGTAHLLAISGLHLSLIASLFYFVANFFHIPRMLRLMMTILVILLYTALAGAKMPVLRAGTMGVVILVGLLLGQDRNLRSAFFFAFLMILIWDPSVLFQASFQLSFTAIAALIFLLPKLQHVPDLKEEETNESTVPSRDGNPLPPTPLGSKILVYLKRSAHSVKQVLLSSLAVMIGLFPILIWYFHLFSPIGFVANLVAIPIAVWGIAATFILLAIDSVSTRAAALLKFIPSGLFEIELRLIEWFADVPLGNFFVPAPPPYFLIIYYGLLLVWLIPVHVYGPIFSGEKGYRIFRWIRRAFVIGLGFVSTILLAGAPMGIQRLVIFDLGKTDSSFMSFSNRVNCLINAGRHFPSDQAYWVLRPFLMGRGVRRLDHVLLTQADAAHAGGFQTLLEHVPLKHVWVPVGSDGTKGRQKYVTVLGRRGVRLEEVSEGDVIHLGSTSPTHIKVLAAAKAKALALLLEDQKSSILYVSSSAAETFKRLSELNELAADLVFLPHYEGNLPEEMKLVLGRLRPRFIVSNQRDRIPEFKVNLGLGFPSEVLFLADSGALEFERMKGGWSLVKRPRFEWAKRAAVPA